ncbi:hypothetical protein [Stackebrandtia soli]|uniref:hypothetical protein n=1 Tax=Stackebrandtia soli TaxID=1892856 RepID=UPI0039E780C1
MTYAPRSLMDARAYIIDAFGISGASVGIVGDPAHRGGYHCGSDRTVTGDYSVVESIRDKHGLTQAASALDVGMFSRGGRNLRHFSLWLVDQCKRGAPDTADIREVIYSPDGRVVKRWDRLGRRSSGDDSHLWHTHISYHRDSESRDKLSLFKRYIEGDNTMDLDDKVKLSGWIPQAWPDLDETITVRTALGSAYGHARQAKDIVRSEAAAAAQRHATEMALLQQIAAGQASLTEEQIEEAVKRGVAAAIPSPEVLASAIAERLDHDLDTAAVAAALRDVLGRLDE